MTPLQWALAGIGLFVILGVFVIAVGTMLGAAGASYRVDEKR